MANNIRSLTARLIRQCEDEGRKTINTESHVFKELKNAVRYDEALISPLVHYALHSSSKCDCSRRLLYLSVFDYFFNRSNVFRVSVINNLQEFLHVFVEIDPLHRPLPAPKEDGSELKLEAIKTIKVWHEKFSVGYERLQSVADFLSTSKSFDFKRASAALLVERQREEEVQKKIKEKADKTATLVSEKYSAMKEDINRCVKETKSAVKILVPVFSEDIYRSDCSQPHSKLSEMDKNLHGYGANHNITVVLRHSTPQIQVTRDNESIVSTVRDGRTMMDYYRKHLSKWMSQLSERNCEAYGIFNDLITVKAVLDSECVRIDDLKLPLMRKKNTESESEESDMEDVPEKEMEYFPPSDNEIPAHVMKKVLEMEKEQTNKRSRMERQAEEPCCSKSMVEERKPPNSIPVVPFGLDLQYWGDEKRGPVEVPRNNADCHRFWRAPDEDSTLKEQESVYTSRLMTFIGEGRKPTMPCRARLNNGKLCPRMDVERCPVHGPIIRRDEEGFPLEELSEEASAAVSRLKNEQIMQEEQEFIADVEAATGKSLATAPHERGNRRKKKEVPIGKVVRERLERKLLDKRTIKRVSEVLDAVRKAKIQKKFGGQFIHALNKK